MSIAQVAAAARAVWPSGTIGTTDGQLPTAVVMTAIAGAESGYNLAAQGDSEAELAAAGASPATIASVATGGCGGYGSWGAWQVFLPYHLALVAACAHVPSFTPCQAAAWLTGGGGLHAALAANEILYEQGLGAWSTYTGGAWRAHLAEAQAACGIALTQGDQSAVVAAAVVAAAALALGIAAH